MNIYFIGTFQVPQYSIRTIVVTILTNSWKAKKTNKYVLETLAAKRTLLAEIKSRQIKYFGHIKRHDTLLKFLLEGKVEGQRARGRQRYKWEGNIKRWGSAPSRRETENAGGPLHPTFDEETTPD